MSVWAIAALFTSGGVATGALGLWLLYKAGWWGGAAAERQKIEAASAKKQQRMNDVLQKEVSDDDLQKSLKDGTF